MDRIRRTDLEMLLEPRSGPFVSLFMPLHPESREALRDPIQLRDLLDEAEEKLIARGLRSPEARNLLAPLRALPADNEAWQHRGHALAAFAAPNFVKTYHVDGALEASVHVNDQFCLRPLLPLLSNGERFFLLALSQNIARLYEGDSKGLREVTVKGMPRNLAEATGIEDAEHGVQAHSAARGDPGYPAMRGKAGKEAAVFHGQGGKADAVQDDLREYVRKVASAVDKHLTGQRAPLLLATIGDTVPIWREASRYEHTEENFVTGGPDRLSPAELHAKAWPLAEAALARYRDFVRNRLHEADGSRVSFGLRNVVPAAIRGRIDALFIDCSRGRWGRYHPEDESVELHAEHQPGDQDLVELAAVETLRHRGEVFASEHQRTTGDEAAQALLRF